MWRVEMLGPLRVRCGQTLVTKFQTKKNGLTLAMMACERRQLSRAWLSEQLWPNAPAGDERKSLRVALSWLRKNLSVERGAELFIEGRDTIEIDPDSIVTDLDEFESAVASARTATSAGQKRSLLQQATALYRGPFLEGWHDSGEERWIESRRHRLETLYLEALQMLVAVHESRKEWRPALDYALRALETNPGSETHRSAAMRLSLRAGDWSHAVVHQRKQPGSPSKDADAQLVARLGEMLSHLVQLEGARQAPTEPELTALDRTLDVALALLRPDDRRFLLRLAVFPAPFTAREAAEVLDGPDAGRRLDTLESYSLVFGPRGEPSIACELRVATDDDRAIGVYQLSEHQRASLWKQLSPNDRIGLQRRHAEWWHRWALSNAHRYSETGDLPSRALLLRYQSHYDADFAFLLEHDFSLARSLIAPIVGLYHHDREWTRNRVRSILRHPQLPAEDWDTRILGHISMVQGTGSIESIAALRKLSEEIERAYLDTRQLMAIHMLVRALQELGTQAHHNEQDELAEQAYSRALELCRSKPYQYNQGVWTREVPIIDGLCDSQIVRGKTRVVRATVEDAIDRIRLDMASQGAPEGPEKLHALLQFRYGSVLAIMGEYAAAAAATEMALDCSNRHGVAHGEADCLIQLGHINLHQGRLVEARILIGQSVTFYTKLGVPESRAAALGSLGDVFARQGNPDRALSCYNEGVAVWRERGHLRWQAVFVAKMAALACAQREDKRASELAAEVRRLCSGTRSWKSLAKASQVEGDIARRIQQWGTAQERYREALRLHANASHWLGMTELVEAFAVLALEEGLVEEASRLLLLADLERDTHGASRPNGEYASALSVLSGLREKMDGQPHSSPSRLCDNATLEETVEVLVNGNS